MATAHGLSAAAVGTRLVPLEGIVAQATHDLNNHLATILGKAEIALMLEDPDRWKRGLENALEAGNEARILVSDLQRLVVWLRSPEELTLLSDLLTILERFGNRRLRRAGMSLVIDADGPSALVQHAGQVLLGLWGLLDALSQALTALDRPAEWHLTGAAQGEAWIVRLEPPGGLWPDAVVRELERTSALGEDGPHGFGTALELLRESGAETQITDTAFFCRCA